MTLQIAVHEPGRVRLLQLVDPAAIGAVLELLVRLRGDAARPGVRAASQPDHDQRS